MITSLYKSATQKLKSKEFTQVVFGKMVEVGGTVLFLKLLAALFPKELMGSYLLGTSISAFILTISFSAINQGVLRNIEGYKRTSVLSIFYSSGLLGYLVFCFPVVVALLLMLLGFGLISVSLNVLIVVALWISLDSIKGYVSCVATALRERGQLSIGAAIEFSVKFVAIFGLYYFQEMSVVNIFLMLSAASFSSTSYLLVNQRNLFQTPRLNNFVDLFYDSIRFCWPMMLWGSFGWSQNMAGRWILESYAGLTSVAEYGVLTTIGSFPVTAIFGVLANYLQPILYEKHAINIDIKKIMTRVIYGSIPIIFLAGFFSSLLHIQIVEILASANYVKDSFYLPFIVISSAFYWLGNTLSYSQLAQRKVALLLIPNIIPGVFSIIAGILIIPSLGVAGAILVYCLGNLIGALIFFFHFYKS